MRARTVWIVVAVVLVVIVGAYFFMKEEVQAPVVTTPSGETTGSTTTAEATSTGQTSVKIYLVDIGGQTTPGPAIGCGDHMAGVPKTIPATVGVLKASLEQLFSLKDQKVYMGELEYYNALYQSDLKVDSATVQNGVATVKISGTTQLGGECDDPRAIAQIKQTVMQFPTVTSANIFINNKPLEEYFSLK